MIAVDVSHATARDKRTCRAIGVEDRYSVNPTGLDLSDLFRPAAHNLKQNPMGLKVIRLIDNLIISKPRVYHELKVG